MNHEEPDRVSIDFGGLLSSINLYTYEDLLEEMNIGNRTENAIISTEWSNVPKPSEKLLEMWSVDFRRVWLGAPDNFEPVINEEEKTMVDEWGLTWKRIGKYNEFVNPPLEGASLGDVLNYRFPDPEDCGRYRGVKEWAEKLYRETEYAVVAGHSMFGVFELGCRLCGFNDFLHRLLIDKKFVRVLFDRVLEIQKAIVGRYILAASHNIQDVTTPENVAAMYEAGIEYGRYPLGGSI